MARPCVIQNQFTRGELSPLVNGRIDLEQYYQGAATVLHWLPLPHGGTVTRSLPQSALIGNTPGGTRW